jgi:hypothetical protein
MYKKINKKERKNLYIFIKQMSFVNKNNKVFFINKRRLFYTNIQMLCITYVETLAILTNVSRPHEVDVALLRGPFFFVNSKYKYIQRNVQKH